MGKRNDVFSYLLNIKEVNVPEQKKIKIKDEEITINYKEEGVIDLEQEIAQIKWALIQVIKVLQTHSAYHKSHDEKIAKLIELTVNNVMTEERKQKDQNDEKPKPKTKPKSKLLKIFLKYNGKCASCDKPLKKGWTAHYDPDDKKVYCSACARYWQQ